MLRRILTLTFAVLFVVSLATLAIAKPDNPAVSSSPLKNFLTAQLGQRIFFDEDLSLNRNQACAACHSPAVGWTGPESAINALGTIYMGSMDGRFGNRKPPSAAYAGYSPVLHNDNGTWIGGMFWDGRATGSTLGDPLAEQAQGPFLNPLEQAMPNAASVVSAVCDSHYAGLFKAVWGPGACSNTTQAYESIARSIAAFERSRKVSRFTSKYDYYLAGKASLTVTEAQGLALFEGDAKCSRCHPSTPGPYDPRHALFTDYTYDNLGVPKNPLNPFYYELDWNPLGLAWVDLGLGGFLNDANEYGKFKVPTLRNVDKKPYPFFVKAFGHNGYFKSLEAIVHFYNTRDTLGGGSMVSPCVDAQVPGKDCWPAPEYSATVNTVELGKLGLTPEEEASIVAFLKTLSDGWRP